MFSYLLEMTEERLQLVMVKNHHVISSEFLTGTMGYRRVHGGGRNQLIARAVGLKGTKASLSVIDATAGLGKDGFVLATLGCSVQLIERSPIILALLEDGLKRAAQHPETKNAIAQMRCILGDAHAILQALTETERPDVIYLDPMFPPKQKNALSKIEMRVIHAIVGEDQDADALLNIALVKAKKRVVVKRPKLAASLARRDPDFLVEGKSNRYDVYLARS